MQSEHTADCPHCGQEITVPVEPFDTMGTCPKCGEVFTIQYNEIMVDENDDTEDGKRVSYEFSKLPDDLV